MQQIDQVLIQIVMTFKTKDMAVVSKASHFHLIYARMRGLSPQPEIAIQSAFPWHGSSKLHFCLKNNSGFYRKGFNRTELF